MPPARSSSSSRWRLLRRIFLRPCGSAGKLAAQLIGGAAAEIIMVLGYFGYASLWLGKGLAAAASIPGNLVQGVFGIAAGIAVYAVLDRSHVLARA